MISLANDYIDGVSISKSSDSTDPLNTISKEDMIIILNERSEEKIYTTAESKDDDDKETDSCNKENSVQEQFTKAV